MAVNSIGPLLSLSYDIFSLLSYVSSQINIDQLALLYRHHQNPILTFREFVLDYLKKRQLRGVIRVASRLYWISAIEILRDFLYSERRMACRQEYRAYPVVILRNELSCGIKSSAMGSVVSQKTYFWKLICKASSLTLSACSTLSRSARSQRTSRAPNAVTTLPTSRLRSLLTTHQDFGLTLNAKTRTCALFVTRGKRRRRAGC